MEVIEQANRTVLFEEINYASQTLLMELQEVYTFRPQIWFYLTFMKNLKLRENMNL